MKRQVRWRGEEKRRDKIATGADIKLMFVGAADVFITSVYIETMTR